MKFFGLAVAAFLIVCVATSAVYLSRRSADGVVDRSGPPNPSASPSEQAVQRAATRAEAATGSPAAPQTASDRLVIEPTSHGAQLPEGFVGTAACAGCHQDQYRSYLRTHHSRSLSRADVTTMEDAGSFSHPLSSTSFDIYVRGEEIWHRQWLEFPGATPPAGQETPSVTAAGPRMVASDLPVEYVIGSGAFAKGYLLHEDGFLIQSPVTWYRKPEQYGVAPGYDVPHHLGTTRVVSDQCMFCHVGLVSSRDGNDEQLTVHESAISCERCHGAGAEHATLFASGNKPADSAAPRIVHPGRLDRAGLESICAQCHLQGDIFVHEEGRTIWDFKPGEPLEKTRVAYQLDAAANKEKTFVDHFDQLWQSECYQQSDTLTCVTCHDPHHESTEKASDVIHTEQCLACHTNDSCGVELDVRMEQEQNRCFRCHMPRVSSEIPHTATTNHRIAVHRSAPQEAESSSIAQLRRLHSPLADEDVASSPRSSTLAQAYWQIDGVTDGRSAKHLGTQPLDDLLAIESEYRDDIYVQVAIAWLARLQAESQTGNAGALGAEVSPDTQSEISIRERWALAEQHALRALELEPEASGLRKAALDVLFAKYLESGEFHRAAERGTELVRIRRSAPDWYNLGLSLGQLHRLADAEQAFREAIRIDATYQPPYRSLFKIYSAVAPELAGQVRQTAIMLEERRRSAAGTTVREPAR